MTIDDEREIDQIRDDLNAIGWSSTINAFPDATTGEYTASALRLGVGWPVAEVYGRELLTMRCHDASRLLVARRLKRAIENLPKES